MVLTPITLDTFLVTRISLSSRSVVAVLPNTGARRSTGTSSWFPGNRIDRRAEGCVKRPAWRPHNSRLACRGTLCEPPGCSEAGAASDGMVPEDLLFWVDMFHPADRHDTGVLCRRHADAMVVPRGWTLDDRRGCNRGCSVRQVTRAARSPDRSAAADRFGERAETRRATGAGCRRTRGHRADAVDAGVRQRRRSRRAAPCGEPLLARAFRGTDRVR